MRISLLADTHLPSTIRDLWGEGREVFAGVDLMEPEECPIVCLREVYPGGQPEQGKARHLGPLGIGRTDADFHREGVCGRGSVPVWPPKRGKLSPSVTHSARSET